MKGIHEAVWANILAEGKLLAIFPLLYIIHTTFFLSKVHGIFFFLIVIKHQRLKQNFKSVRIQENLVKKKEKYFQFDDIDEDFFEISFR